MTAVRQWDIVRFRIRPSDSDLHPGVVVSGEEWCASPHVFNLNVIACSKKPPADAPRPHQVELNSADGLDFRTTADCRFFHIVPKEGIAVVIGHVSAERRRALGRKINEVFRFQL